MLGCSFTAVDSGLQLEIAWYKKINATQNNLKIEKNTEIVINTHCKHS